MTQIISTEAPSSLCWGFLFLVEHFYSRAEKMLYSTSGNMRMKTVFQFNLLLFHLRTNVHKSLSCFDRIKYIKCFAIRHDMTPDVSKYTSMVMCNLE